HAGAGTVLAHWTGSYVTDISRSPFNERHSSHATSCRTIRFSQHQRALPSSVRRSLLKVI
ncbi:MAG TPA: hypothetical protein VHN16_11125, partial [Streptosporangiaceae bacterium]|nr:hypothetical protein [Streptosporangiaceae bacterium]